MACLQWAIFLGTGTVLVVLSVAFASEDPIIITAGQTGTLACQASNNNNILVEWTRPDLDPENVLVYRGGHFLSDRQHPSFKNRVDLQDRQMKDGDVSLILKDVTAADEGTYKCRVLRDNEPIELICTITLRVVSPPGPTGGLTEDGGGKTKSAGLKVGPQFLLYCFLLLLLVF